jgi:hypothetical protein
MNKARLDWVISGLNQHALTKAEDQFLKKTREDFEKNQGLPADLEERLENLYKAKSQLIPNKNQLPPKETPKKPRPRRPIRKIVL